LNYKTRPTSGDQTRPASDRATRPTQSVVRSAGVIGIATMTSRVLGLIRDQVLAYFFGAGDAMDAFRIAFRLPNALRDLFAEGALSAALVPTFTRALATGDRAAAWRLASNVASLLLLVSGAVVLAGILFADPLVNLYAAGFRDVPGKIELTVRLTKLMFPFLAMVAVAAVLMAMLNALHRFFVPALSPAMFNVATIACALVFVPLAPRLGIEPIVAIAIGTLAFTTRRFSTGTTRGCARLAASWSPESPGSRRYRSTCSSTAGSRQVLAPGRSRGSITASD
jgi:putative peptidoglycan lipid II flippase